MTAAETIAAAIEKLEAKRAEATTGPWYFNLYGAVFGADRPEDPYDPWIHRLVDAGHSLERYGGCDACNLDACAFYHEDYDRNFVVAEFPAIAGDTAAGHHKADAELIEILYRTIDAQLDFLREAQAWVVNGHESSLPLDLARAILGENS